LDEVGEGSEGIHILISWRSGIELICPVGEVLPFQKHLAAHGEGFYCLVFGVASLDEAMTHIRELTGRMPHVLGEPPQKVYEKFTVAREAIAGSIGGVRVMLGEFEPQGLRPRARGQWRPPLILRTMGYGYCRWA
jgi:hypothetical protein